MKSNANKNNTVKWQFDPIGFGREIFSVFSINSYNDNQDNNTSRNRCKRFVKQSIGNKQGKRPKRNIAKSSEPSMAKKIQYVLLGSFYGLIFVFVLLYFF
jgi:hypothetical protein